MPEVKPRPLSRDREYLLGQIEQGQDVLVGDTIYNRGNVVRLPSQEDLDAERLAPKDVPVPKPEPEFAGRKLSAYRDLSDEQITKLEGPPVDAATLAKIRAALKK